MKNLAMFIGFYLLTFNMFSQEGNYKLTYSIAKQNIEIHKVTIEEKRDSAFAIYSLKKDTFPISKEYNLKALDHVVFSNFENTMEKQIKGFCRKYNLGGKLKRQIRIRTVELSCNNNEILFLDSIFKYLKSEVFCDISVLIIDKCPRFSINSLIHFINSIDTTASNHYPNFKQKFKKRPGIYYLNSLILRYDEFDTLPAPTVLGTFNYLEEFRAEKTIVSDDSIKIANAKKYFKNFIENWLIPRKDSLDFFPFENSLFPNLRFLAFNGFKLRNEDIPNKLKVWTKMVGVDFSNNCLTRIPEFFENMDSIGINNILSINLSCNQIYTLSSKFLFKLVRYGKRKNKRLNKNLFLSHNQLLKKELKKFEIFLAKDTTEIKNLLGLKEINTNMQYKHKEFFNTLSFANNKLPLDSLLDLTEEIETKGNIANFMTGAQKYVNDYFPKSMLNPKNKILNNCSCN